MNRFSTSKVSALLLSIWLSCSHSQAAPPASAPATLPANVQTDIEYGRVGDYRLLLDTCAPGGDGPFPVVIIVHGGGWSGGDKERDITPLMQPFTSAGFTWFSINYRLAPKNRWPACFEDVQTAIRWVKANAAHYVAPTEDNSRQCARMKDWGIYSNVSNEIGQIIVAQINTSTVATLTAANGDAIGKLIRNEK